MIKAHKESLAFLKIEHCFLTGEKNSFCNPVEISASQWNVAVDSELYESTAVLHVKYGGNYLEIPVEIIKAEPLYYKLILKLKTKKNKAIIELLDGIEQLEKDHSLWDKRKEDRYEIGTANSEKLGLNNPQQKLVVKTKDLPCLINNVSFSGASVTTYEIPELKQGFEIMLVCRFTEPIEYLPIKGYIQSVTVKSAEDTSRYKFAVVSIQFVEPPLAYKQRLGSYIQEKEGI